MNFKIPTDNEIRDAISEIFDHPHVQKSEHIYRALVPEDPSISNLVGYPVVGLLQYSSLKEMQQLCKDLFDLREKHDASKLYYRLSLIIYCHIMEADFLLTCIWNLIRLINCDKPQWVMEFKTKKGDMQKCNYPKDKIEEIQRQSNRNGINLQIGNVLTLLWNSDIRNSFNHSNYAFIPETNPTDFLSCKPFTPNKRVDKPFNEQKIDRISLENIDRYCNAAMCLNSEFNKKYNPLITKFQQVNR